MAAGEQSDGVVVVSHAQQIRVDAPTLEAPLRLTLRFAHYVSVGGTLVPDALLPWDGGARAAEQANQPLWLQVTVPLGTAPGTYHGEVTVVADGTARTIPIGVARLPRLAAGPEPGERQPPDGLPRRRPVVRQQGQRPLRRRRPDLVPQLYRFLASYRLSPSSWGYGAPSSRTGYTTDKRWWLDPMGQMTAAAGDRDFAAMTIPISNNRTSPANYIAGLSPAGRRRGAPTSSPCTGSGRRTTGCRPTRTSTARTSPASPASGSSRARRRPSIGASPADTSWSPGTRRRRTASSGTGATTTSTTGSCSPTATTASTPSPRSPARAGRTPPRS